MRARAEFGGWWARYNHGRTIARFGLAGEMEIGGLQCTLVSVPEELCVFSVQSLLLCTSGRKGLVEAADLRVF